MISVDYAGSRGPLAVELAFWKRVRRSCRHRARELSRGVEEPEKRRRRARVIAGYSAGIASPRPSMAGPTGSPWRKNRRKAIRTSRNRRTQALGLPK